MNIKNKEVSITEQNLFSYRVNTKEDTIVCNTMSLYSITNIYYHTTSLAIFKLKHSYILKFHLISKY